MKSEPLKNKGTETTKVIDFIIDLLRKQVDILNKTDGTINASIDEDKVKFMQEFALSTFNDEQIYEGDDIKSAVEWLELRVKNDRELSLLTLNLTESKEIEIQIKNMFNKIYDEFEKQIKQAFQDVMK